MLTARVAGSAEPEVGMVHGIVLWSAAVVMMLVLTGWGVSGLVNTGASVMESGLQAGAQVAGAAIQADRTDAPEAMTNPGATALGSGVAALLKRESASILSQAPAGGAAVSEQEARVAIEQVDAETLQATALQLVAGETDAAKDTLAVNTDLSEQQIDDLVVGVQGEVQKRVAELKAETDRAIEAASIYAQAVLWTTVAASALGLLAAILGGFVGAPTVYRENGIEIQRRVAV